jgi:hypothetical protein
VLAQPAHIKKHAVKIIYARMQLPLQEHLFAAANLRSAMLALFPAWTAGYRPQAPEIE